MDYILSIDAGTTAFKTSLFDENGRLLGISTREYELLTPTALAVELPAETFWNAFKFGIKDIIEENKSEHRGYSSIRAFRSRGNLIDD